MPNLYIVSGCNGVGKTTASYSLLPEMLECSQYVNSDEFAKSFSPSHPEAAQIKASRFMVMKIKYLLDRREDFGIETTLATRSLLKTIKEAQKIGYHVTVLYLWLDDPKTAIERVKARVGAGGHFIPESTIIRRYHVGLHYFFRDYMMMCDRWILADNSKIPFTVVGEGNRMTVNIKDVDKYSAICQLNEEYEKATGYDPNNSISTYKKKQSESK